MKLLKVTEEYRVESEQEAKDTIEKFREESHKEGYTLGACGFTYKDKESKGEVIDEGYLIKTVKIYSKFWD